MAVRKEKEEPLSPREFYGEELRRRREAAELTQEQLGERVICSPSLIAHFEAGRRKPQSDIAARIDSALGTDGFFTRMRRTLDPARYANHFADAAEAEQLATVIQAYSGAIVPGLLQTADYARAIFRAGWPNTTPDDVDKRVVNRLRRAEVLTRPDGPEMWALLDEHALRRLVGGRCVMAEQLQRISDLAENGRIRVYVVPFSAGAHAVMESMVKLMRFADSPPVAYVEGLRTGRLHDDPATVADCQAAYDLTLGEALSSQASLDMLQSLAEEYRHEP